MFISWTAMVTAAFAKPYLNKYSTSLTAEIGAEEWNIEQDRLRVAFDNGKALEETQKVLKEIGFDATLPPDPLNKDSVNQVINLGLASSQEEAMYLLSHVRDQLKILKDLDVPELDD